MTWSIMGLVILGALLHAGWNVLVKSSQNKSLDTALIHTLCAILALPAFLILGPPPAASFPFLFTSVAIHIGYYFSLAKAYEHGSLGLTYPIMRGTAPLIVALSSWFFIDEALSFLGWLGVLMICFGVIWLGISSHIREQKAALAFAFLNAVIVAAYTIVDAQGVRISGDDALAYIAMLFSLDGWIFGLIVFHRQRHLLRSYIRLRMSVAFFGALASVGSYSIALWAMSQAPVALVAALREMSVLFAILLGRFLLKETLTLQRLVAIFFIITGAISLRMS